MSTLKITLLQAYLFWENIDKNLQNIGLKLSGIREKTDLIILPEMFTTGFTMNAPQLAEDMEGKTMNWLKTMAHKYNAVITGSFIAKEENKFFNRLVWMNPDGTYNYYDKRHLFGMAKEDDVYTAGKKRLIVELKGWKIMPLICYDLRFPVWMRNTGDDYDLAILIANWPERRAHHWRTLIPARAVENQSFVIAVNRIGHDGNEIYHCGDSTCIDPNGVVVYQERDIEDLYTFTINKEDVTKTRKMHPFLKDADHFQILLKEHEKAV